jgi:hypothetical protein
MGDPRIVEITQEGRRRFVSKTLVPNIMHVNHESREEGSRRYSQIIIPGSDSTTFIDWDKDTLLFQNQACLENLFKPGNAGALSLLQASKIAVPFNSLHTFLYNLNNDRLGAMEELYVIRPTVPTGGGNLELVGEMHPEYRLTHLLHTRDTLKIAVTVDAVRDANRLLEGEEKIRRDKQRAAKKREDQDMLIARM